MTDTVRISGVSAMGCHGVYPEEHSTPQRFVVDIAMEVDVRAGWQHDALESTISYGDAARDAVAVITGEHVDLIETLAQRIADRILARGALCVEVTVHKPDAPVDVPFTDASVTLRRRGPLLDDDAGIRHAVVALGANLGKRRATLDHAIALIRELDVHVTAVSPFMLTKAQIAPGQAPQPDYLNAVLALDTALSPLQLLDELQRIEVRCGRVRHGRWSARRVDIDIIDFAGIDSDYPRLLLPHPRAAWRLFVLEPWARIEPDASLGGVPIRERIGRLYAAEAGADRFAGPTESDSAAEDSGDGGEQGASERPGGPAGGEPSAAREAASRRDAYTRSAGRTPSDPRAERD